jgi:D-inositol-3-phosphate glycosyltransferase
LTNPRRVAVLSVHTSPLAQPGTGDAGGMNVYVLQTALRLARRGVRVEIFTRATASTDPPVVSVAPGVLVRNVVAGPFEGLDKYDLPTQLCAFAAGVLRAEAVHAPGYYDIVHSHYWLSGQVGWLARDRWSVPLVHTAHTLAAVKNAALADGDAPEPPLRTVGEQQVVDEADRLIANTEDEAAQLVSLHQADPGQIDVAYPGVDLDVFRPGDRRAARAALGLPLGEDIVAFVGRIQPLKAPDILLRAVAKLPRVHTVVAGGPSGSGLAAPDGLVRLAGELGISARVTFLPPQPRAELARLFQAADLVAVPSYSESFGLVALEAQACGTPVVAAAVGGLPVAVRDGISGSLVFGHDVDQWAAAIDELLRLGAGRRAAAMRRSAIEHASTFSWDNTVDALLASYRRAIGEFDAGCPARGPGSARRSRPATVRAVQRPEEELDNRVPRWAARRGVRA